MSLRDEQPKNKEQAPFASTSAMIEYMNPIRNQLEHDMQQFLAKGGKITYGPDNAPVNYPQSDLEKKLRERNKARQEALSHPEMIGYMTGKNRFKPGKSGHQNITIKKSKSGEIRYIVSVANTGYGTYTDLDVAIGVRDRAREKLGLDPADY